jgi:hypothetical protein
MNTDLGEPSVLKYIDAVVRFFDFNLIYYGMESFHADCQQSNAD